MRKRSGGQGDLNGFLDGGSHMSGELRFDDTFRIDGKFTGTVVSDGDLIVGESGEVEAEVSVGRVFVSGLLRGKIKATQRVEISSVGKVMADLETPSLTVEDGAFIEGRCSMSRTREAPVGKQEGSNVAAMPLPKKR